jgi:glutathione S-transferase
MLKIWGRVNSINVQKVMWMVGELGLPHERVDAGMQYGIVNEPWYRALNPNGRVPTIDDGGFVLWESNAIVRYLAAEHGDGRWIGDTPLTRASADRWMDWASSTVAPLMTPLFWGLVRTPPEKRDPSALEEVRVQMEDVMRVLDRELSDHPYVAGDRPTVGDVPLGCFVHRWHALPMPHEDHPGVSAWYRRLAQRPAFREHVMLPLS